MSKLLNLLICAFILVGLTNPSFAAGGSHYGVAGAFGFPYTTSFSLMYLSPSNMFSAELINANTTLAIDSYSIIFNKPSVMINYHPFSGAFYLGLGYGQQTLEGSGTDPTTGLNIKMSVTSSAPEVKLGWMWGVVDGGFLIGLDVSYLMPSNASTTITTSLPVTNSFYTSLVDKVNSYGSTAYTAFSYLKLGYLF